MRRLATLIVVASLFVAGCGSSSSSAPAASGGATQAVATQAGANQAGPNCSTGTYNGHKTTTYCGTAKATVTIAGKPYEITGGKCLYEPTVGFAVTIGTTVLDASDIPAGGPQYFSVIALPDQSAVADGAVNGVTFVITDGAGTAKVTVAADHKSGTVSGTALLTEDTVTATFTC